MMGVMLCTIYTYMHIYDMCTCLAFPRGALHEQGLEVLGGQEAEEADGGQKGGVGGGGFRVGVPCRIVYFVYFVDL